MNGLRPTPRATLKDDCEITKADISGTANYAIHGRVRRWIDHLTANPIRSDIFLGGVLSKYQKSGGPFVGVCWWFQCKEEASALEVNANRVDEAK